MEETSPRSGFSSGLKMFCPCFLVGSLRTPLETRPCCWKPGRHKHKQDLFFIFLLNRRFKLRGHFYSNHILKVYFSTAASICPLEADKGHEEMRPEMLCQSKLLLLALTSVLLQTGSGFRLVENQNGQSEQETLSCFRSPDPEAVKATLLYGDHKDKGDLWSRGPNTAAPLPRCSSSSSPPPAHCEVCRLVDVYVICHSLPAGTKLFLEGSGLFFQTEQSACPSLPAPDGSNRADSTSADFSTKADGCRHYLLIGPLTLAAIVLFILFMSHRP